MPSSRREVLTGAAGLAAASAAAAAGAALPASLPTLPVPTHAALDGWRPYPSPADLHEMGRRIGPWRVIMDVGLIQEAIDALDDYQLFDSPEERRLITQLQEALYSRPSLIGLCDGPGSDI